MKSSPNMYAIVLAADEDTSLDPLTRALSSRPVPKQYAFIAGEGSLLQQTVGFYASVLSPARTAVVVATRREDLARAQLRKWRGTTLLSRPRSRGPAFDVMLALERITAGDPDATVIVTPAHDYLPKASVLLAALLAAEPALATVPVVLAGVPMNGAILGSRLVVPGPPLAGRVLSVRRFVEDWPPEAAPQFKACGALWDTSVLMGRAATLGKLAAQPAPAGVALAARLGPAVNTPRAPVPETLHRSAARMPASPWLQGLDGGLGVVAVRGSGWSAWSSPAQVMESLRDPHQLDRLLCRIHQHQQGIDPAQLRRRFRSEASQRSTPALCIAR